MGDTLSFLNSLEQEFIHLREDAVKIKIANQQMTE